MQLSATLNANQFKVEAQDGQPDVVSLFRLWLNAQGAGPAVTLEELTESLAKNTDQLEQAVAAATILTQEGQGV